MEQKNICHRKSVTFDIFVGHVPKSLPKGKLEEVFLKYGAVVDVLYRHGNGAYGYVIVKFKFQRDAEALLREVNVLNINGFEMEVRRGKINQQNIENNVGSPAVMKTVTFADPCANILTSGNTRIMEPVLYDANYSVYHSFGENAQIPVRIDVICTSVESSLVFFACHLERYQELLKLAFKLNNICPTLTRLVKKPNLNKVYAALFEDNAWYRCTVLESAVPSKPGVCIVQYIDYGNIAEVYCTNMVEIPDALKCLRPFADKYIFANLVLTHQFPKMASFLYQFVQKHLILHILTAWGRNEYQVFSCICAESGLDIIGELVGNGSATYMTRTSTLSPPLTNRFNVPENVLALKPLDSHKHKKSNNTKSHKMVGDACNGKKKGGDPCNGSKKNGDPRNGSKKNGDPCNGNKKNGNSCNGNKKTGGTSSNKFVDHSNKKVENTCSAPKSVSDSCNDVAKSLSEVNNNEMLQDNVNGKGLPIDFQQSQDFVPKKIMQRGGSISISPATEQTKTGRLHLDFVLTNLKVINNIRRLFPLHSNDDAICDIINFLKNEVNDIEANSSKELVESSYQKYCDALNELKECTDQELLVNLKEKRNNQQMELLNGLKQFIGTFDYSLLVKRKKIQETIISLESSANAWMNVYLSSSPDTLEDLLKEYIQEKDKMKSLFQKVRENTNEKHSKFLKFLENLRMEFTLNIGNDDVGELHSFTAGGIKESWTAKFEEALAEVNNALEEEDRALKIVKDKNQISVIDCILEKLDVPKEKIDAECELYEKYATLIENLSQTFDLSPIFDELYALKKNIEQLAHNCVFNGDSEKTSNDLLELHAALLREDILLGSLAKAYSQHFPELVLEHPDLKLDEYQENSYLLKHGWVTKYFPSFEKINRVEPSYVSRLADEAIVVKEVNISCNSEKEAFLKKAVAWNEIRSKFIVKIKGLFTNKDENLLCSVAPPVWKTLYDSPLPIPVDYKVASSFLQQVLAGLCDIHSRGITHGAMHPAAILHEDGKVLLDFNFDKKYLQDKFCLNGINFQVPSDDDIYKSADMYGFGCLVLWVLFPNMKFSSTDQKVPNLSSFQSIIEQVLSNKDFASLSALLNINQDLRPSSRVLLSNGFLKKLPILSGGLS